MFNLHHLPISSTCPKIASMSCQFFSGKPYDYVNYILQEMESPQSVRKAGRAPGPAIEPLGRWCDTKLSWPCTCPSSQIGEGFAKWIDGIGGKSTNQGDVKRYFPTSEISIDFTYKRWEMCAPCSLWVELQCHLVTCGHSEMMTSNGFRQ